MLLYWSQKFLHDITYTTVYIHDSRNSSDTKRLFSRQPFSMPKSLYTRLPCIKYKGVIYTAAVSHTKIFIYTAAVHRVQKTLFTRQAFLMPNGFIHGCRSYSLKVLFTRQPFSMQDGLYTLLPCLQHEIDTCFYTAVVPYKNARIACFLEIYWYHVPLCKMQNAGRLLFFTTECNVCGHFYQFKETYLRAFNLMLLLVYVYQRTMWKLFMASGNIWKS